MRKLVATFAVGAVVGGLLGAGLRPPRVVYQTRVETRSVFPQACRQAIVAASRFAKEAERVLEAKDSRFFEALDGLLRSAFWDGWQHDREEFYRGTLRSVSYLEEGEKMTTADWLLWKVRLNAWANHGPLDTGNYVKECEAAASGVA
jgi:hypothetical protein